MSRAALPESGDFPLRLVDERPLPRDWTGAVHVWDVDRTDLDTDLSSLRGLLRLPLELAIDKRTVPGVVEVLRECRRGPGARPAHVPLYFVTASPPQLEGVLRRRMLLDGLEPDGLVLKDQLRLARRLEFARLRSQVAYKLTALWRLLERLPAGAELVLVGDDWESDALVFARLAAVQQGALSGAALDAALRAGGVRDVPRLRALAERASGRGRVRLACVLLTRGREPRDIAAHGPALRAARDALQLAAVLLDHGLISTAGLERVARGMAERWRRRRDVLERSALDAAGRGLLRPETQEVSRRSLRGL